jgi:hypothetical protein
MTVEVRYIGGGGGGERTSFTDDFNRALLGENWLLGFHDPTEAGQYDISGSVGLVANTLSLANNTGAGQAASTRIQPLLIGNFMGREQFAEATINLGAGSLTACGPGVAAVSTRPQIDVNGYYLGLGVNLCDLRRMTAAGVVITAAFTAAANGDKFRITVAFGVGSNTIRTFKNDVLVNTTVDAVLPSPTGLPCMYMGSISAANSIRFDPFRCGLGSGS